MTALEVGVFVPQGWKLEYTGWTGPAAWERSVELAELAEALGYDHLWVYDHVETVPRRRPTHVFEAFTMLAALSQRTSRVGLGQLMNSLYRNAGLLAKEAACVDVYSAGRLILGLGPDGSTRSTPPTGTTTPPTAPAWPSSTRPSRWSVDCGREETVTFHGDHLRFEGAYADPKPVQDLPPVLVGGGGEQLTRASPPARPTSPTGR